MGVNFQIRLTDCLACLLLFWTRFLFYLQLFLIEGLEQVLRNDLIEAFLQGQKLSLDAMQETPVHIQPAENTWKILCVCGLKMNLAAT